MIPDECLEYFVKSMMACQMIPNSSAIQSLFINDYCVL